MRRPATLFERLSRQARQPTAAEIAAVPVPDLDPPPIWTERDQAAAAIHADRALKTAFLRRTSPAGEVVSGLKDWHIARLREIGVMLPDRLFLTPVGIEARAILAQWAQGKFRP